MVRELKAAKEDKRGKMLDLIQDYGITVLDADPEALRLADVYIEARIIPENYLADALHIAIASINGMDMILSLNFKHIVSRTTEEHTGAVNKLNGYRAVEIRPPMEVAEYED